MRRSTASGGRPVPRPAAVGRSSVVLLCATGLTARVTGSSPADGRVSDLAALWTEIERVHAAHDLAAERDLLAAA